jgi:hypothetical protein
LLREILGATAYAQPRPDENSREERVRTVAINGAWGSVLVTPTGPLASSRSSSGMSARRPLLKFKVKLKGKLKVKFRGNVQSKRVNP